MKTIWAEQGAEAGGMSQADMAKLVRTEIEKWAKVVKDAGAKIETISFDLRAAPMLRVALAEELPSAPRRCAARAAGGASLNSSGVPEKRIGLATEGSLPATG